jgi:hypothetical protein
VVKKNDPDYVKQLLSLLRLSSMVQHRSFSDDIQMGRALWVRVSPALCLALPLPMLGLGHILFFVHGPSASTLPHAPAPCPHAAPQRGMETVMNSDSDHAEMLAQYIDTALRGRLGKLSEKEMEDAVRSCLEMLRYLAVRPPSSKSKCTLN